MAKKKTTAEEAAQKIADAILKDPEALHAIKTIKDEARERADELKELLSAEGYSREFLIRYTSYLGLGSERQLEVLKGLYLSFMKYKDEAPEGENTIEYVLQKFRNKVAKSGSVGLMKEKDVIPIVSVLGTPKDKAALVLAAYWNMRGGDYSPILNRKEVDEIRESVRVQGEKAMKEFVLSLSIRDALHKGLHLFYRLKHSYSAVAYQTALYFHTYEWLGKAEELFNSFAPLVDPNKKEEFAKLTERYNNYLQNYQQFGELDHIDGDKWVDKQRKTCLEWAEMSSEFCAEKLSDLKGAVEGFTEWIADNKAEILVPTEVLDQLSIGVHFDTIIKELQCKYKQTHLETLKEEGKTITEEDKKIALFPNYEDVATNTKISNIVYNHLDGLKKNAQA